MEFLTDLWNAICSFTMQFIVKPITAIEILDVVDIFVLSVILFELYRFTRNRRAGRVMVGLLAVVACGVLATVLELRALSYLVQLFAAAAFFCFVVLFQPELRDTLERLGNSTLLNPGSETISRKKMEMAKSVSEETTDAVFKMAKSKTGALIVFEGLTKLGEYIETGKPVDARVTSNLLQNIFYGHAPLHDGALVIRNMRILAASCVLPSTKSRMDFGSMGTRHRAAVGVTEVSDALVVVVSEQTGVVSVAQDGKLLRDVDEKTLLDILMTYIAGNAYLRQKRANVRKEYLEMLENVAQVDPPQVTKEKEALIEKEFKKMVGETEPDAVLEAEGEVVAPVEATPEEVSNDQA